MFKKKDVIIVAVIVLLIAAAVTVFIFNRQQFKIGNTNAIIDNNTRNIFVSLPAESPPIQDIYFNFPFKNDSVYIKKISSGSIDYNEPEEIRIERGKPFNFEEFISHSKLIVKSGRSSIEYDLWVTTGDVPIFTIDVDRDIPDEPKVDCSISIFSKQKNQNLVSGASEIEIVDLSDDTEKHSYSFNIKENLITGNVPQILDFESSKRFSLSALYYDRSLSRQKLAYDIYKSFDKNNISPDSRFVELFINGQYRGVYLLSRRVERDMFAIENYNKKDEQHSVIYEASNKKAEYLNTTEGFSQMEPDYKNDGPYFEPLEQLVGFIADSEKQEFVKNVGDIADIDNIVDNHILFLLSGSTNKLASNQFIYRGNKEGDKFNFSPGSHYISGFGRDQYSNKINPTDITYATKLYNRLYEDKDYRQKLKERWNYLRQDIITADRINEDLDKNILLLNDAQYRNFKKWPTADDVYSDDYDFLDDLKYMKAFADERILWLDNYINYPPLLKIGETYAFINEKNNIIFCALPENASTKQKITWEFDESTEIFIEPLNCGKYINFKNNFQQYKDLAGNGKNNPNIKIFIDSFKDPEESRGGLLKITGRALNSQAYDARVEKVLIFDGSLKNSESFLGEASYNNARDNTSEHNSDNSLEHSGFELVINTLYLNNGMHEFYIYAYDESGNYSVEVVSVNIRNSKNKVFRLENTGTVELDNGADYDFKEFIYRGNLNIKNKDFDKQYELFVTTGNTPLVLINAENWIKTDIERTNADMKIIYNNQDEKNFIDATVFDFEGKIGIRTRGQSTLGFPKKQYAVEIRDENDDDVNVSLLGMPRESDWILSAPYSDKALIRMPLAFELSNQIGLYASRTIFVEVFLYQQGSQIINLDYMGAYILTESIKRDKNRVDIQGLDSGDEGLITGGYLLEMTSKDLYKPHETYIETLTYQYIIKYPNAKRITEKQKQWITDYMNEFESTLYGENFMDKEEGYLKFIDVDSFIDFIIVNELFKNKDAFGKSTFISKDRDSKLKLGPVWDFDLSSGNNSNVQGANNNVPELFSMPSNRWCNRLFLDPFFVNKYIEKWKELRQSALSDSNIIYTINDMVADLSEVQERNFQRWQILGIAVYPNPPPYAKTHSEAVEQLKEWLLARTEWIDNNIETLHTFAISPESFDY